MNSLWQPDGIDRTYDSLDTVVAKLHASSLTAGVPGGSRIERYEIATESSGSATAEARVRGDDYAISIPASTGTLVAGRTSDERWRKAPGGTVRSILADVQFDGRDRWPVAELGFDLTDCSVAGVSTIGDRPAWVIADRPQRDIPRFLYVDKETGDIVREVSREGVNVVTYDFSDVRGDVGARRAYRWTTSGAGDVETVSLVDSSAAGVAEADVQKPSQGMPEFLPPTSAVRLDTDFLPQDAILVHLRVDGTMRQFQLGTGLAQILSAHGDIRGIGPLQTNVGIASTVDGAGVQGRNIAYRGVGGSLDGVLGYDFFRGRIVHVNYARSYVEVLPRDGFVPPNGTIALPTDWSEGVPIVSASTDDITGSRFALDMGSAPLLVSSRYAVGETGFGGLSRDARTGTVQFLEGPVDVKRGTLDRVVFGNYKLTEQPVLVEQPNPANLAFPLDGILGTDELSQFEW